MVVGGEGVAPKPPGGAFPDRRPGNKVSHHINIMLQYGLCGCQSYCLFSYTGIKRFVQSLNVLQLSFKCK